MTNTSSRNCPIFDRELGSEDHLVEAGRSAFFKDCMRSELPKLCGAKGNRTPDLLDTNEWTWAFAAVDTVGCTENLLVKRLSTLALMAC
jgi:hypothetical protein